MIKLITLLLSVSLIGLTRTNPVPEDTSVDWSTRIADNVENVESIIGSAKFNFDDSSEADSTFSKREASPVSGPLDAPLGWGARLESSAEGNVEVSPPSGSGAGAVVAGGGGGSGGGAGGDNKQKVDWALNPGDNKKLYSSNDAPEVIEQKKEETLPLAPESSKPSEEANPDPYKNILPAVLTGKRRLGEGDKPVQSAPSTPVSSSDVTPSAHDHHHHHEKVSGFSLVDNKGQSVGQAYPYDKSSGHHHAPAKPDDKSVPQHVYTEDQFPSVITIKGREYLVIPHKSNDGRPLSTHPVTSSSSPWYSEQVAIRNGQLGSPFFTLSSSTHQPAHGHGSKSSQSSPTVPQIPAPVAETPSGHHQQFVSSFPNYPHGQSSFAFGPHSFPQHPGSSGFNWKSQYPVYHSSVFTNPNVQQSPVVQASSSSGKVSPSSVPSVFSNFFPQYGQYPASSSSPVIKNFEFFTPPTRTVTISSTSGDKVAVVASPPVGAVPISQGEVKGNHGFVPDPSFSPKLQESVQSSPSVVGGAGVGSSQQESFVTKPFKPESNLHAPPQIPNWNPYGFSVVAGSYPVQSSPPSVSSSPSLSPPLSSSTSKTHVESPAVVTVETKFSAQSPVSPSGTKGGSAVPASSPSVTVGSSTLDSAADQPAKSNWAPPLPQQQDQQQVGVAGETLVPTTNADVKNDFIPSRNFLSSSSGYFVSPSVNQSPPSPSSSSVYSTSSSVSSSSPGSPFIPPLAFPEKFFTPPWQSAGYNFQVPASPPSPYFDSANPITPSWDHPFFHQKEAFFNQRGLNQPDFDYNQIHQQRF